MIEVNKYSFFVTLLPAYETRPFFFYQQVVVDVELRFGSGFIGTDYTLLFLPPETPIRLTSHKGFIKRVLYL